MCNEAGRQRAKAKHKVHRAERRESKTIFGALDLASQRMYWKQVPRGNAKTLIEFLHQLHQSFPDQLLVVILDNCSIHNSKKVKAFVARAHNSMVSMVRLLQPKNTTISYMAKGLPPFRNGGVNTG
jgi:transposase